MPTNQENNQFRRLVGDYSKGAVSDNEIQSWLDDTTMELTQDFATPIFGSGQFDAVAKKFHNEIVHKAAINWWWNKVAELQNKISTTVGQVSADTSQKWQRAFQMIQELETRYEEIRVLGYDIQADNASRWSKQTLRRIGGVKEEDTYNFMN